MLSGVSASLPASLRTPSVPNSLRAAGAIAFFVGFVVGFFGALAEGFPATLPDFDVFADFFAGFLAVFLAGFFEGFCADFRDAGLALRADTFDCFCFRLATTAPRRGSRVCVLTTPESSRANVRSPAGWKRLEVPIVRALTKGTCSHATRNLGSSQPFVQCSPMGVHWRPSRVGSMPRCDE